MGVAVAMSGDEIEAAAHQADQAMYAEKARYYAAMGLDRRHA